MKHEWKKEEKELYMPRAKPEQTFIPKFKYFVIEGGDLTDEGDLRERIEVIQRMSKTIKDMPKRGFYPGGFFDYSLYPVEMLYKPEEKNYKLMIRQPEFVTSSVARMAVTAVISRNPHPLINEVSFMSVEDGNCVQMMCTDLGQEDTSTTLLLNFVKEENLSPRSRERKKIYINDSVKTLPEKQKYVLRLFT